MLEGKPRPPEAWLRGPVPGIQPALQPVAHALLQVAEDLPALLGSLTPDQVWARPGGSAPIGFHVAHLAGSLTRLFTYARGEALSPDLQKALEAERRIAEARPAVGHLLELLAGALDAAFQELERVPPASLWDQP